MGKWESKVLGIIKAAPVILGASTAVWVAPVGGSSAIARAEQGMYWQALEAATANLTFYSANSGAFEPNQGITVKATILGLIISKAMGLIEGAL